MNGKATWWRIGAVAGVLAFATGAQAQPYIGFVYPAGGKQGTTFPIKMGGQAMTGIDSIVVSGTGVQVKLIQYLPKLGPQEITLLREQLAELKQAGPANETMMEVMPESGSAKPKKDDDDTMSSFFAPRKKESEEEAAAAPAPAPAPADPTQELIERIEKRIRDYVQRPASVAISNIVHAEVTIAPDAPPGEREIRFMTTRGVSNPMAFYVSQLPETVRKPMGTSDLQVLGKEELALRKRPADEVEVRIQVPSIANGQVASGERNLYRFEARKGQRLVISVLARHLIPYVADAVPGWFQPVLALYDAKGRELAYNDDYRFKPDPTIMFEVPEDGEYVFAIFDSIYRGREDWVYRISIGELPIITNIFPIGVRAGEPVTIKIKGWNLGGDELALPTTDLPLGIHPVTAMRPDGFVSNAMPFAIDGFTEVADTEPNDARAHAQKIEVGTVINGHINRPDDWDVYRFTGRAGQMIVAEVNARRLDSPVDSSLRLTDATGKTLAFNDDREDPGSGMNTHHADSYIRFKLPADGDYFLHMGETGRCGGEEYAYRLRVSPPQPDFALRVVPSGLAIPARGTASVNVFVLRKDGFTGPIRLGVKNTGAPVSSLAGTIAEGKDSGTVAVRAETDALPDPITMVIEGRAIVDGRETIRDAVAAEDRMQAFLWRHLVPAQELKVKVFDPNYEPPPKRVPKFVSNP